MVYRSGIALHILPRTHGLEIVRDDRRLGCVGRPRVSLPEDRDRFKFPSIPKKIWFGVDKFLFFGYLWPKFRSARVFSQGAMTNTEKETRIPPIHARDLADAK